MKKILLIFIISQITFTSLSQPLAAFNDYRKYFIVFDGGKIIQAEHLPVQSYQIGGNCIPYISNSGDFKVYYNGEVRKLTELGVSKYITTRNFVVFFIYNQLYVFDNGKTELLSSSVKNYAIGDSIIAFYNENKQMSYAYYNRQIIELERSLVGNPIMEFKAGDNICAYYNDNTKYFKVFYNGKLQNLLHSNGQVKFKAGRNTIAYIDESLNSFHAFYKGEIYNLEDFTPKSFKVGNDMIAYIDNLGDFKVFTNGETQIISSFEPEVYEVRDSLVVFSELGYFKVFYKDQVYELENYIPQNFQMQESTIAFIGLNGWLKAFTNGEYITVTNDFIKQYKVAYNLIYMNTTVKTIKIYYNGKMYDTN